MVVHENPSRSTVSEILKAVDLAVRVSLVVPVVIRVNIRAHAIEYGKTADPTRIMCLEAL